MNTFAPELKKYKQWTKARRIVNLKNKLFCKGA